MFCPSCGLKEDSQNQFCRSCGSNLNNVRVMLDKPDGFSTPSASAKEEIGRSVAAKIQQTNNADELSQLAEDVLPEIEKFLETPEEKKLRRLRNGGMVSFIGLGTAIAFFIISTLSGVDKEIVILSAFGLVTLFIGLAIMVNGLFFTVPKNNQIEEFESETDLAQNSINATTNDLLMPASAQAEFSSVTESTTRHLKEKKPVSNS